MRNLLNSLFFPPFLRRLDEKLLVERPSLWATRLHRVAWPAFLLALFSLGLGLLTPVMRPYIIDQFITLGTIGIVLAQIGLLIYWLYRQDAYSTEREHGIVRDKTGWREFSTYLGALGMIGLSLFLFLGTVRHRADTAGSQLLARDLFLIHLMEDLEARNGYPYLYEAFMGRPPRDLQALSDTERAEEEAFRAEYQDARFTRRLFEVQLLFASDLFTPDNKQFLLEKHIFDGEHISRFENGQTVRIYRPNSWWDAEEFIVAHLNMDDLIQVRAEWEQGDFTSLLEVLSQYSDTSLQEIEREWQTWEQLDDNNPLAHQLYIFYEYMSRARSGGDQLLQFAFNPNINFALMFWAIVGAIAVHLSLLRFTFKHSGLKGFILLLLSVVCVAFAFGLYMFTGEILASNSSMYYGKFIDRWYIAGALIGLLFPLIMFSYARQIPRQATFTWKRALALYTLPLLVALTPYLIFSIEELVTGMNSHPWFSTHFMRSAGTYVHIGGDFSSVIGDPWTVAPLGQYMLYFAQFAYIPLLGWLKQKHTRLMSLPRT